MATVPYNYIYQSILASSLIEPKDIDSFYFPTTQLHTGYAWDGTLYYNGVQQVGPIYASWYLEGAGDYRGSMAAFPQTGLVLLSNTAMTITDGSTASLELWMLFLLQNNIINPTGEITTPMMPLGSFALANNFNSELNGWLPSGLTYANGIVSVIYSPDYGNQSGVVAGGSYNINSNMVVNIDFTQDTVYLDVAVADPVT